MDLLRLTSVDGIRVEWNAAPEVIRENADWFFSYLERFSYVPRFSAGELSQNTKSR